MSYRKPPRDGGSGSPVLEQGARVLIAGVSARAFAASAARAGYRVTALDPFGDVDLRALADVVVPRRSAGAPYAPAAARAAHAVEAEAAAYTANFENYPDAIAAIAAGRRLLGNAPDVVARVRQQVRLMRTLRRLGFAVPRTRAGAPALGEAGYWLVKPRKSGGGHGTRGWRRGATIGRGQYIQERITGIPGSIAFAANGQRAVPLGMSRQLVGDAAFGARGFRYCGSLAGDPCALFEHGARVGEIATALAEAVTAAFGLIGVNGIDFIVRDGVPYPIEVNPRYSASMELVERARRVSLFEVHARACGGELPRPSLWSLPAAGVSGKAIVFARRAVRLGDTATLLDGWHADVPHPGERIGRGQPICTVFGRGRNLSTCYGALVRRAEAVISSCPATRPAKRDAA